MKLDENKLDALEKEMFSDIPVPSKAETTVIAPEGERPERQVQKSEQNSTPATSTLEQKSVHRVHGRKNVGLSSSTAKITLPAEEKERFTRLALKNGLTFSAFIRLAGNTYISTQGWED